MTGIAIAVAMEAAAVASATLSARTTNPDNDLDHKNLLENTHAPKEPTKISMEP